MRNKNIIGDDLHFFMNENLQIIDRLTNFIHDLQDLDPDLAFFAMEAQENLMKGHVMMLRRKKGLDEYWDSDKMCAFLRDIIPLFELYDVEDEDDWVADAVGNENERNVRLIRTVYLISRVAEFHAGTLASIKINFRDLYKRMEKNSIVKVEE